MAASPSFERIKAVKRSYEPMLLAKPNVVGVGIGYRIARGHQTDTAAIVVMVSRKLPANQLKPDELIPSTIEGVPVDVQETGALHAQG
jgi:hypothetical protein